MVSGTNTDRLINLANEVWVLEVIRHIESGLVLSLLWYVIVRYLRFILYDVLIMYLCVFDCIHILFVKSLSIFSDIGSILCILH